MSADVLLDNAQDTQTGENFRTAAMDIRETPTLFRPAESFVLDSQNEVRPSLKPFRRKAVSAPGYLEIV